MLNIKLHTVYCLIIAGLGTLLLAKWQDSKAKKAAERIHNLPDMVLYLRDSGIALRTVPQRDDGLWADAVYLTQTNMSAESLKGLCVHPERIETWQGTVIVNDEPDFARHNVDDWDENGWRWGRFFFYGDRKIISQIATALSR
jgi:hypothetical protein